MDATDETAPAEGALAAEPKRHRRRLSSSVRRVLLAVLGVLLLAGSVAGFYLTADAFDERIRVVVAAAPLSQGQVLSPGDLTAAEAHLGDIPYIEWTADAAAALSGFAVSDHIPAGGLIGPHMLVPASSEPVGDELEVVVPLDTSPCALPVPSRAISRLLIDPGVDTFGRRAGQTPLGASTARASGLRRLERPSFRPAGGVGVVARAAERAGGDPDGVAGAPRRRRRRSDRSPRHAVGCRARGGNRGAAPLRRGLAGRGRAGRTRGSGADRHELGALWSLPGRLGAAGGPRCCSRRRICRTASGGVAVRGARTLRAGRAGHLGRTRGMAWWHALPVRLGAAPMVLRVASGTDVRDVAERLNEQWRSQWQQSQADGSAE